MKYIKLFEDINQNKIEFLKQIKTQLRVFIEYMKPILDKNSTDKYLMSIDIERCGFSDEQYEYYLKEIIEEDVTEFSEWLGNPSEMRIFTTIEVTIKNKLSTIAPTLDRIKETRECLDFIEKFIKKYSKFNYLILDRQSNVYYFRCEYNSYENSEKAIKGINKS